MEQLITIDQQLLLAINSWHAPWADLLMWYVSARWVWIPLYLLLICLLAKRFGWKQMLVIVAGMALAVALSDYLTSGIMKPLVARWRPSHDPLIGMDVHIVDGYRGGKYGFPSSHAANTMTMALLFSLLWKNRKATLPLMLWVAMNCYSRMYLGVHYPLDILVGLCVGSAIAYGMYRFIVWTLYRFFGEDASAANPLATEQSAGTARR